MTAPSFSSFPPSFASFPELEPGPSRRTSSSVRNDSVDARHKTKRDKSKRRSDKKDEEKNPSEEGHLAPSKDSLHRSDTWTTNRILDDEKLKAEEDRRRLAQQDQEHNQWVPRPLFYSDRRGDPLNITYGSLHDRDVPKYHLVSHGKHVLGLDGAWSVFRRAGKGVEITIGGRQKQPSLTEFGSRALLAAPSRRLITTSGDSHRYEEVDGFLRLPSRAGRRTETDYRSITKFDTNSDSESSPSEGESSDDDLGSPTLTTHQLTIKALEEILASNPSSIETWSSLLSQSLSAIPVTSKNATKARSEITLAIISRARTAHPSNFKSRTLLLKYLRAGEEVWHGSKLNAEWEDALKLGGIEVWMEWLEWRIRKSVGGIDAVVTDATRGLKALGNSEESEVDKLRTVWRVAVAFQEAGFYERAIALFQAQAELTFEVPQSLYGLPVEMQLESLEEFWDSEVPRVGEPDSKGWSGWMSSGRPEANPTNTTAYMGIDTTSTDPFIRWYNDETRADSLSWIPARSIDETSTSDPYATVLFSDIKALLLSLTTQRAKNAFRFIWLSVLGLHIPGFVESLANGAWNDRWSYRHLTSTSHLSSIFPEKGAARQVLADSHAGTLIGKEREYSLAFGPVKDWSWGVFGPLEWVGQEHWRMWTRKDVQGVNEEFVRAVFNQLRCGTEDYEWDVYSLAFEAAVNVKNALKISRSLLSNARDSLPHWAVHARLERLRGRIEDARKVYQTVLISTRHSPTQAFIGQLWWDWVEMEWLSGDLDVTLRLVMRSGNVDGTGGMMILRAKRNLEDIINAMHGRWKDREAWVKLRALMELLTASSPLAALALFDSQPAGESDCTRESLMVASLLMLYNHSIALRRPTPPAILRDRLQFAMETYPSNTIILGMFLEAEKGYGVWGRVRGQLGEGVANGSAKQKSVVRRVAEVWVSGWEKGRWEVEVERTRSGLVAALESDRTRNSAVIWRIVLEFEIRTGQLQRAKNLLYRAVGECPLAKELYLLAFGPLRHAFKPSELTDFVDIMAERGLRMRRGLEGYGRVLEVTQGTQDISDEGSAEGSEDDIEHEAKERRRLMPY
ncbi:NRDE-2, necessary for RNA interference-domain-containing protein [Melanogaster broomeanus]|nr:NRDE-2, necessary for RNA interference-domain-containing protein [Melanogaster broomeanus]